MFAVVYAMLLEEEMRKDAINKLKIIKTTLRDISDPFRLDEEYFRKHYRLTPHLALELINELENYMTVRRTSAIPVHLEILSTLRFLAEGAFQKGAASDFNHPMSQSSMSRCIDRVLDGFQQLKEKYIKFPQTRQERENVSNNFRRYIRIPGVIGLIDCFLVACIRSKENEEAFFNYKAGPSMNVQVITDANYKILSIYICPGSNNDRFIWNYSDVKEYIHSLRNDDIVAEEGNYYVLGDSGYTPSRVLLTPILDAPPESAEEIYTNEHMSTRCKVEQTFGVLTNTWLSIKRARKLYYTPEKVGKIIITCAVLHNFRRLNGVPMEVEEVDLFHNDYVENHVIIDNEYLAGIEERNALINEFYR